MFSTSFLHKSLVITTIFMIILTSVSTSEFIQMIKMKENFQDYKNYFEYLSTKLETYERKMTIEEFYYTLHNRVHIETPASYGTFDYNDYINKIYEYCENNYVTLETFITDHDIIVFGAAVLKMNDCLNAFLTTVEQRNRPIDISAIQTESTKSTAQENMIEALEWSPFEYDKSTPSSILEYDPKLLNITANMKNCLHRVFKNDAKEKKSFVNCIYNDFKDDNKSKKYASHILKNMQSKGLSNNGEIESCIGIFHNCYTNLFQTTKRTTLKELYLALSLIYYNNSNLDDINMTSLYQYYKTKFVIRRTELTILFCKGIKVTEIAYTMKKLFFIILPRLSEHKSLKSYKMRRIKIIDYLLNIDKGNSEYYNEIKMHTGKITKNYLQSMIKRRAMKEEDYGSYVLRMNIRGYLPLPKNLWIKEQANSHKSYIQKITTIELIDDLQKNDGHN